MIKSCNSSHIGAKSESGSDTPSYSEGVVIIVRTAPGGGKLRCQQDQIGPVKGRSNGQAAHSNATSADLSDWNRLTGTRQASVLQTTFGAMGQCNRKYASVLGGNGSTVKANYP
eukprot:GHVU01229909.1.p1 GENE.GHVU01229909.1~~GHVU01229909.1.p1  ORF type:complete len:114 (+),score=5.43 GHVU01229909.1:854-1195(+)